MRKTYTTIDEPFKTQEMSEEQKEMARGLYKKVFGNHSQPHTIFLKADVLEKYMEEYKRGVKQ